MVWTYSAMDDTQALLLGNEPCTQLAVKYPPYVPVQLHRKQTFTNNSPNLPWFGLGM